MKQEKILKLTEYYKEQNLTDRQVKNRLKKEEIIELAERNQKPVKELTITIEWKKSYTDGYNPKASVEVKYLDGGYEYKEGYKCSGGGYDKESTVVAQIFNDTLKYKLWELEDDKEAVKNFPYGARFNFEFSPVFEGGVGVLSYYRISEAIGGKFENISSGKTFDVYKFTMTEGAEI